MTFGLTNDGFTLKRLADIRTEIEDAFKSQWGEVNVGADSVNGQLIGVFSKPLADVWEQLEKVYLSQKPSASEGVSLDDIVQYLGILRTAATNAIATVACEGNHGVVIPAGNRVRASETLEEWEAASAITISRLNMLRSTFEIVTANDSTSYSVTINYPVGGAPVVSNYTSGVGQTKEAIATALAAVVASDHTGDLTVVDNLDGTFTVTATDLTTEWAGSISGADTDQPAIWTPGSFLSINTGAITAPAGAIDTIVNAVSNWRDVENLIAATPGTATETDTALRARREEFISSVGAATVPKIESRILQEVDDVSSVFVVENRSSVTDGAGRPPHSFETVVQGGLDQDVADKIWEVKPAGIATFGNVNGGSGVAVIDSQGNQQFMKFSRPIPLYIWCYVEFVKYDEEVFPADGVNLIKEAIRDWGNALGIGVDVIRQRIAIPIYTIPGVGTIDVWLYSNTVSTSTPVRPVPPTGNDYDQLDHEVAANEISTWTNVDDVNNIEVVDITP